MKNENLYTTPSLDLAAALIASSLATLKNIEFSTNSPKAYFVLNGITKTDLDRGLELFWAKDLIVDASTYFETLKSLKSRLYEVKNAR